MGAEDDNSLLREARELFESFRESHSAADKDGGSSAIATLNRVVREEVSRVVEEPLQDALGTARDGASSARSLAEKLTDLPSTCQGELSALPGAAGLDSADEIPGSIRTIAETLSEAAKNPSLLFPRLLCGSIPLDPARIGRALSRVNTIALSGGLGEDGDGKSPESSGEFLITVGKSFGNVANPVVEGMDKLVSVRGQLKSVGDTLSTIQGSDAEVMELAGVQQKVTNLVDKFTELFSNEPDGDQPERAERGLAPRDCVDTVDEGARLARSAGDITAPLKKCVEAARALGDKIMEIANKLRELFHTVVEYLGELVELVKQFIANLPTIVEQLRQFFVPTGFMALILASSEDTTKLLHAVDKLREAVPTPERLTAARGQLTESRGATEADSIIAQIKEIVSKPLELVEKLSTLASELPRKIIQAARDAIKRWVKEHGVDIVGDKIEDGLQDIAGKIGGEKLADAVGDFLPFGSDDENDAEARQKKEKLLGAANNLIGSFF